VSIENDKKLQKLNENSREEKQIEDDLGQFLNFAANQGEDGDDDKSLEIPGSLETDLAKDIDR
jgi:hypothetical protein